MGVALVIIIFQYSGRPSFIQINWGSELYSLHTTLTHDSKKLHGHCYGPIPVNSIDPLAKLCEGNWKGAFPTCKGKRLSPNAPVPSSHWPGTNLGLESAPQRSMTLLVGWEGGRDQFNIQDAKGTDKPLPYLALNVTMNHTYNRNKRSRRGVVNTAA